MSCLPSASPPLQAPLGDPTTDGETGGWAAEGRASRLSLEEKTAQLGVRARDCRSCRAFRRDDSGMNFGWCTAFDQYVKLYHPAGEFWSQCQFKVIARTPATAEAGPEPAVEAAPMAPRRAFRLLPATD